MLIFFNVLKSIELNFIDIKYETDNVISKRWATPQIQISFMAMIFGIVMEWRSLIQLFKRQLSVNWFIFVIAIILIIVSLIPTIYWTLWFGFDKGLLIGPLRMNATHILLNVLSGILLIRSLTKQKDNS